MLMVLVLLCASYLGPSLRLYCMLRAPHGCTLQQLHWSVAAARTLVWHSTAAAAAAAAVAAAASLLALLRLLLLLITNFTAL
jgi:hypothetical protein